MAPLSSLAFLLFLAGCGGGTSSTQVVSVTVSSSSANVLLGNTQQVAATVTGTSNQALNWSVNGVPGGNSMVGTVSGTGLYAAPRDLPSPTTVTIEATSAADSSASSSVVLTITSDISVNVATNPAGMANVFPGAGVQLVATLASAGHPDPTINWAVNGVANGNSAVGTISVISPGTAWYNAPANPPNPASVTITADCAADASKSANLIQGIQACTLNGTIGYVAPPAYKAPSGATCDVSDVNTLNNCVTAARSGSTSNVRFTAMVNCSGNNACLVDLSNLHGPVTFFGEPGVTAGFLRTDTYTYSILNLNGTSDITFANLTFDDGPDDPACAPYQSNGSEIYPCQPTIFILSSSNILLEQLSVLHSKQNGIAFAATQGITIQDSFIQDAGVFGIWTDQAGSVGSSSVSINNNLIQDVKSNGVFISFAQNATISGNTLKHNQYLTVFDSCGGGCAGGQIYMLNDTSLQIFSNQILNGQIDLNNATGQTNGIEISNENTNVLITNNILSNNLGGGIFADPGTMGTSFVITGNKIYNNPINVDLSYATGVQEFGDCNTQ